jgi:DNA-directed RNA polymerase specialized sigma24 family protein
MSGAADIGHLVADPPERPADTSNTAAPELSAVLDELPPDQREAFSMLKLDGSR